MTEPPDPLAFLEQEQRRPSGSRQDFQQQLIACDHLLVEAGARVARSIVPVTTAFLQADSHAAAERIRADADIERRCIELEEICFLLLATQSPVAGDLRRIVAIIRSTADVQRAAALIRHVAESLTWVHPPAMPENLRSTIGQLGAVSSEVYRGAVDAWRAHDGLAATELQATDDQVDLLQKVLLTDLYTGDQSVEESVSLALIARYYERIADHGVEMARQVTYFLTGDRITED